MKFVLGFLAIVVGALIVIYTEWIVNNFGRSAWAEQHLGASGGTRLMYKLIGLAVIILSLMTMTGMLGNLALSLFGNLFGNIV